MNDSRRVASMAWLAFAATALTATGQEADTEPAEEDDSTIEEVVVTGFRSSLMSSIQTQRSADS
ncbi:MAG: hypothetical protein F4Z28_09935, partial [Gammaproteobacteria bacterium]|nr:hypothetical protein [Gammaproteobacteria bacterium]